MLEGRLVDELTAEVFSSDASYYALLVPNLVPAILHENADEITSKDDVIEAVGDHIQSSVEGLSDEAMHNVCEKLMLLLHGGKEVKKTNSDIGQRRLLQTVDISTQGVDSDAIESIWRVTTRDTPTMVDKKKLEKAQAKALEKCAKREILEGGISKKKRPTDLIATASQAANRRDTRADAAGQFTMDVHLENVDVSIGNKQLLCGADVTLVYGRRYGLVGRNGAGKSTFLKMISSQQLIIPSNITMLSVEQEVDGDEIEVVNAVLESDLRRMNMLSREKQLQELVNRIGLSDEEKEKYSSELTTLYAEMEAAQVDKAPARAASILFGLGFTPEEQRRPTKPDLLLLDEPTNMLDMRAIFWLENHLQEWTTTIVIVSHDRSFLNAICTDIIHLHSRRLDQYRGNYTSFEKAMREKLAQQQREYEAQQQLRQHTQVFIDKFRYNAKRASMVQSRIKMLERLPVLKPVEIEPDVVLRFPECETLSNPVLQLDEVSFKYTPQSPLIFQKVCIASHANSRICIVGENGAGKTTLLKMLMGELSPSSGFRNANRRLKIGYFAQHHVDQLDMDLAGVEVLANKFPGHTQEEYRAALGRFGLSGDLALQSVATLSGGQKSRVAFAMLAMLNPNYLIMDEPTNHLDVETVEALGKALAAFKGGVVIVSHDERLIELVCKELWVVRDRTVTTLEGGLEEYKKQIYKLLAFTS
ncbi:ATP-binding cassette sub-family F member 3 [Toxocara canis]|uniref:ATP-binding cassette sub-family F member 3 n=1 Tax=Toxocara canis TaxID=6265 RepID=A0A0B2V7U0_TOXCA|nr:ATP-binding cassette sub-family F member 3 [Toxocara canis]